MMNEKLLTIGREHGLDDSRLELFVETMEKRFPDSVNDPGYMGEWAGRFRNGTEWAYGDYDTRRAMVEVIEKKWGPMRG